MTTILVHGAWSTGDVWRDVLDHLGGDAHAPTLPGCGQHGGPIATLEDVVDALVELVADHHEVTLVGHSWSGLVTWQTAARATSVDRLLLINAFEPRPGASLVDAFADDQRASEIETIAQHDGWWPPPSRYELAGDPSLAPGTLDRLATQLQPHPGRTVTDPVGDDLELGSTEVVRLEGGAGDLDPGHWPMVTAPGVLAAWIHRHAS
jgi:pimeloyl-ACP methyl ester carboxylesterase